jgi:hypothetical protein
MHITAYKMLVENTIPKIEKLLSTIKDKASKMRMMLLK